MKIPEVVIKTQINYTLLQSSIYYLNVLFECHHSKRFCLLLFSYSDSRMLLSMLGVSWSVMCSVTFVMHMRMHPQASSMNETDITCVYSAQ